MAITEYALENVQRKDDRLVSEVSSSRIEHGIAL